MPNGYDLYKPLRNHLRKAALLESLYVIWNYSRHLSFGKPFSTDIEVIAEFLRATDWVGKKVFPWELEILAREIILNSEDSEPTVARETLRRWSYFSTAVNKLKTYGNELSKLYRPDDIRKELFRIAHQQFHWQNKPDLVFLTRYFKIFSYSNLDRIINSVTGLTTRELYTLGMATVGLFLEQFSVSYPPRIELRDLDQEKLSRFLAHFSRDIVSLRTNLRQGQKFDQDHEYTFNWLRAYPILQIVGRGTTQLISPLPALLYWRFTDGIYYEICNATDFGRHFGVAFQNYVGEVLKVGTLNAGFCIYEAEVYDHGAKETIDWILDKGEAALFIECKTKRLQFRAKSEINNSVAVSEELEKLADFVVQAYKAIRDYRADLYPNFRLANNRKVFPIVLTLLDWFIFIRDRGELNKKVRDKFTQYGLDHSLLENTPYSLCSVEDFERLVQIVSVTGIEVFMNKRVYDREKVGWPMRSFMAETFPAELSQTKELFPETYREIYPGI